MNINQCTNNQVESSEALLDSWNELRRTQPGIRIRNAAKILHVSEAELLATKCGASVIRLKSTYKAMLSDMKLVGTVMSLTRNDGAVHEKTGIYKNLKFHGNKAVLINQELDLRLLLTHWCFAFAVEEKTSADSRHSLQFFDLTGTAVHKIYLTKNSNFRAYRRLVNTYSSNNQSGVLEVAELARKDGLLSVNNDKINALRQQWRQISQTHEFSAMLDRLQLSRFSALMLAGPAFVTRIDPSVFRGILQALTRVDLSIKLFVRNKGAIQIHNGRIHNCKVMGSWLNILDDDFNLHLNETTIAHLFIVERPAIIGVITSLELYDLNGNNTAIVSSELNKNIGEDPVWKNLVSTFAIMPSKDE